MSNQVKQDSLRLDEMLVTKVARFSKSQVFSARKVDR